MRKHWPEYLMEAWALGLFMVSACGFGVLLFHPASPAVRLIPAELSRRFLMGLAMGGTAILNFYSPWGRRSGAHMNPAVTLTFWRLGKVDPRDVLPYITAQFVGGVGGTLLAAALLRRWIADPSVNYVVTVPGPWGRTAAFAAEAGISGLLVLIVLAMSMAGRWAHLTGLSAGAMVALYITVESPVSGMSMNPARTVGSAAVAGVWTGWWIYFLAPLLGMGLGARLHHLLQGPYRACAKLMHSPGQPCHFCDYHTSR